jgi:hypothetical protein
MTVSSYCPEPELFCLITKEIIFFFALWQNFSCHDHALPRRRNPKGPQGKNGFPLGATPGGKDDPCKVFSEERGGPLPELGSEGRPITSKPSDVPF